MDIFNNDVTSKLNDFWKTSNGDQGASDASSRDDTSKNCFYMEAGQNSGKASNCSDKKHFACIKPWANGLRSKFTFSPS